MALLNDRMQEQVSNIVFVAMNTWASLPALSILAPMLGVTEDDMRSSFRTFTDNCLKYQNLLFAHKALVDEPTLIRSQSLLRNFQNAPVEDIIPPFQALDGFIQEELDKALAASQETGTGETGQETGV